MTAIANIINSNHTMTPTVVIIESFEKENRALVSGPDISFEKYLLLDEIRRIGEFEENWDGLNGVKFDQMVIRNAEALVELLPESIASLFSQDDIVPNSNGTITLEWLGNGDSILTMEIGRTGVSMYGFDDISKKEIMKKFKNEDFDSGNIIRELQNNPISFEL